MGRIIRASLAVFYAIQVVLVFRAVITIAVTASTEPDHGAATHTGEDKGLLVFLKRAVTPRFDPHESMAIRSIHSTVIAVSHDEDDDDQHGHEPKAAPRKTRHRTTFGFCIRNLFPEHQKMVPRGMSAPAFIISRPVFLRQKTPA